VRTFTGADAGGARCPQASPTATVETVALNDFRYSTTAEAFTGSEALTSPPSRTAARCPTTRADRSGWSSPTARALERPGRPGTGA
jgi:hypothetical protein